MFCVYSVENILIDRIVSIRNNRNDLHDVRDNYPSTVDANESLFAVFQISL